MDATAWMSPEISSVADAVWVIGKGDSYHPFTARSCLAELQSRNYSEIKIRKCCSSDRAYLSICVYSDTHAGHAEESDMAYEGIT